MGLADDFRDWDWDRGSPSGSTASQTSAPTPAPTNRAIVADLERWASLLHATPQRPLLVHLNADTSWLLQLPYPPSHAASRPCGRTHFNVLVDPWLHGPQSDVGWWFSTQWHVVAPSVATIAELNDALRTVEARGLPAAEKSQSEDSGAQNGASSKSLIDVVAVSHEFTDHCHRATLEELPSSTPVFAADLAADLIRSWRHFREVVTTPALGRGVHWSRLSVGSLPPWISITRVITPGNSLYYHSAILVAFDNSQENHGEEQQQAEAVVYSPHGIQAEDLAPLESSGVHTLALLHGMHDVRIWMTKQLNLGARNGIKAASSSGAKYWVATHDEVKKGGGLIAPFLQRTRYTLAEAVAHERAAIQDADGDYQFLELGSGDGLVLA